MANEENSQRNANLRQEYRTLFKLTKQQKDELTDVMSEKLLKVCAFADSLQERVSRARDQAIDSELFANLAEFGSVKTQKLANRARGITPVEIIRGIKSIFLPELQGETLDDDLILQTDPTNINWTQLGKVSACLFRPSCGVNCMLGPLNVAPLPMRQQQRRTAGSRAGPVVKPNQLEKVRDDDRDQDRNMELMIQIIRECSETSGGVPFAELVLNPESFWQSEENVFTLAFLVKDRRVQLRLCPEKGLMVSAKIKHHRQEGGTQQHGGGNNGPDAECYQWILGFNAVLWELMKRIVPRDECKMPDRSCTENCENPEPATQPRDRSQRASGSKAADDEVENFERPEFTQVQGKAKSGTKRRRSELKEKSEGRSRSKRLSEISNLRR